MRNFNAAYRARQAEPVHCPYWVMVLTPRDTSVGSIVIPSHSGIEGMPSGVQHSAKLAEDGISGQSQQMEIGQGFATVGAQTIRAVDFDSSLSLALRAWRDADTDVRLAQAALYQGYRDLPFTGAERLWTQYVHDHTFSAGSYSFQLRDAQHNLKRTVMTPRTGYIVQSAGGVPDWVIGTSAPLDHFVTHDNDYTVNPGETRSYWRISDTDEVISFSGITDENLLVGGLPAYSIDGLERGEFTSNEDLTFDDASVANSDTWIEIEEIPYLEGHPVDLALALFTGTGLPDHWHCNEDNSLFDVASFNAIKALEPDLRMMVPPGEKDALSWVQQHLFGPLRYQMVADPFGVLVLKQAGNTTPGADYNVALGPSDFVSPPSVHHQTEHIAYGLHIKWNLDFAADTAKFLNAEVFLNELSFDRYGTSSIRVLEIESLLPGRDSAQNVLQKLREFHDREWSQPRTIITGSVRGRSELEIIDVARVQFSADLCPALARDFRHGAAGEVDRTFEVHQASYQPLTGLTQVTLFGAGSDVSITPPNTTFTVTDAAVQSVGTLWPYPSVISSDIVIAPGQYHFLGDITVQDGVTVTLNAPGTVVLAATGEIRIDGQLDLTGQGAGPNALGDIGTTLATGSISRTRRFDCTGDNDNFDQFLSQQWESNPVAPRVGTNADLNAFQPTVSNTVISGYPVSLRGTGGGQGGTYTSTVIGSCSSDGAETTQAGGTGGSGGGGLVTMATSIAMGQNSRVILSGTDGQQGVAAGAPTPSTASGGGGGGSPGGWLHVALSNNSVGSLSQRVTAVRGASPNIGTQLQSPLETTVFSGPVHSNSLGYAALDLAANRVRVVYANPI